MLENLFNQHAIIYNRTGADEEGRSIFEGDGTCIQCRIEPFKNLISSIDGTDMGIGMRMFVKPEIQVNPDDKIEYNGMTFHALRVENMIDGSGRTRYKVVIV